MNKKQQLWCFLLAVCFLLPVVIHAQTLKGSFPAESLGERITRIAKSTGQNIAFDKNKVKAIRVTALNVDGKSVEQALAGSLSSTGFAYRKKTDNTFVIYERKAEDTEPDKEKGSGSLSGTVLDEKGELLLGATILVLNTTLGTVTDLNGQYTLRQVPAGTHVIEARFISYETQQVSDVKVTGGKTTRLDLVMKPANEELGEVVVKAGYRQASAEGLYARQKTMTAMSDGISSEQIARTPDNNLAQVIRRISGVTSIDNRYVIVRGLTERYNQTMIDGVVIPSTDMNRRSFSFDMVPQELVSNVVVNKTATPDVSSEFAGGQVTINTLDIPMENFFSFTIGSGYNSRSTGKDFVQLGGRGKYDYLGFYEKGSKLPVKVQGWQQMAGEPLPTVATHGFDALEQSKRFSSEPLALYTNTAVPNQNYRFSFGRLTNLRKGLKLGVVGGITYRNTQEIQPFQSIRNSGHYDDAYYIDSTRLRSEGNYNRFNTTLGGVLNASIQGEKHRISIKNYYSRIFNNNTIDYSQRYYRDGSYRNREVYALPEAISILQNRIEGGHTLSKNGLKVEWSGAMTDISQEIRDRRRIRYGLTTSIAGVDYYQSPSIAILGVNDGEYDSRIWTDVDERDFNWSASFSQPFSFLKDKSLIKAGYTGWHKKRALDAAELLMTTLSANLRSDDLYEEAMSPENMSAENGFYYASTNNNGAQFNGTSKYHAGYLMLDQRFFRKLRLVYGVRAENFNLKNDQIAFAEGFSTPSNTGADPFITGEKNWRFLPSANLTYSLNKEMNFRAAFSQTIVRPDFRETSYFALFDPVMDAYISGWNVRSSKIHNYDLRYEWYPASGEIISVSAFYKKFDDPLELKMVKQGIKSTYLRFENQKEAYNKGLELEIRKSLGFIADKQWLKDLTVFGNGTIMESEVTGLTYHVHSLGGDKWDLLVYESKLKRPLYGQSPWIVNAGLNYNSRLIGANVVYNRMGYRAYTINNNPSVTEYEQGRDALDLQLSARVIKQKAEIKLNISNLLDSEQMYYTNPSEYENDGGVFTRINGTDKYEKDKGDKVTHRMKYGRTVSISFNYRF